MQQRDAVREFTQITELCQTAHSKSGNNNDKPSGKWTHTAARNHLFLPSPLLRVWMTNPILE